MLARKLTLQCHEVIGIDSDRNTLAQTSSGLGVTFLEGDAMTYPFPEASFDFISLVATLHHLPLRPGLIRFRDLLRPGGTLAIIGLYRRHTVADYCWAAAAIPADRIMVRIRGHIGPRAPIRDPKETLAEIRSACDSVLPGGIFKRRLFFRYSFIWTKPRGNN